MSTMSTPHVLHTALQRLRAAADRALNGFPSIAWQRLSGPGEGTPVLHGTGSFENLFVEPNAEVRLSTKLNLPNTAAGAPIVGEPLQGTLFTLYPTRITWNGKPIFEDDSLSVAAGSALFTIVPALKEGDNGELRLEMRIPNHQVTGWYQLRLTTPSLRNRFEKLDILWAQLALAHGFAQTETERRLVQEAAALVPEITDETSLDQIEALSQQIITILTPLQKPIADMRVHLIGHSHIDMNWLWTWPDTVQVILRDFKSVLQLMEEFPELTFSHSQPATYEVVRQKAPDLFQKVLERIKEGRWEATTVAWIENDSNMSSGEAHVRQMLEGVRYSQEVLGVTPTTYHAPDTFGHAGNIPQLATLAGAERYYHHRANPGQAQLWPAYWWEGQDGTRILAFSTPSYNGEIYARDLAEAALRAHHAGHHCALHFHGIGDHGGGPSRQNLEALRRFQKTPLLPTAFCSRLDNYTRELLQHHPVLPVHRGESSTIFEGCYTTHADTKYYNRTGENLLCTADTVAALAGQNATEALSQAWRTVCFNQFHDILDGSAIHEAYEQNREDFLAVKATAQQVIQQALDVLESPLPPGVIAVTNPLGFERTDVARLEGWTETPPTALQRVDGTRYPLQITAEGLLFTPTLGAFETAGYLPVYDELAFPVLAPEPAYAPVDPRSLAPPTDAAESAPYYRIETPYFIAYIRRDCGIIVSLYDKRVGKEVVGYGLRRGSDYLDSARPDLALGVLQLVDEYPHGMAAWHYDEVYQEFSLIRGATTRILETGPVRCVLETRHTVRKTTILQKIIFYQTLPRIDFETHLDWQEVGNPQVGIPNLKVAFTARLSECQAWFETPYAAVRRPSDGQEVPALRWAWVGGPEYGIALLNDSKYGYDVLGCRLRMNLVRTAYEPDTCSDVGLHQVRYSLYPHPAFWPEAGVIEAAAGFNQPLIARKANGKNARCAICRPHLAPGTTVKIGCLKTAHDGNGIIVRLYESAGRSGIALLKGLPEGTQVWETTLLETEGRPCNVTQGALSLSFLPWQVKTLRLLLP
ncbi:alpha-mannosidase [Chthonomonas calidirosea]|uniref:Alpha-mannosidase n=1 Tax=Chthonomonas calidirosea (strain DSM 23976 / ICMP 18418 / T49) TaxID=1303518 RepID=S0EWH9_CHTCT|nr:alpha-mannosidase [Chthonomonas calidirosea]CCW36253.1 Alpha-mannosidase [Chthonomonas calidirosea T49]CEK17882.1 alpha-mannosidase [Chthonomonas calidirosea]